jgi:tryptophanase
MSEIIEPFRIRSVEPIRFTTAEEREQILIDAKFNPFLIAAELVQIDLLTDSGTSAMSAAQWAAIMTGDESYAGSTSFKQFKDKIQEIFGFKHVIPTHQGRAAEKILCHILAGPGKIIPNNNHFDTTRANVEFTGAEARDIVIDEGRDPASMHPFKGNVDTQKLTALLEKDRDKVPFGMVTITNNTGGGQPVSLQNIKDISAIYRQHQIPFIIDACRFAENSYFIKLREKGYCDWTPKLIAQEIFRHADGATMSLKKDGFGNIGGFLAVNDDQIAENARNLLILTEGFPTYGGLAGRDLAALAVGLDEALDEHYLEYRLATVRYLADKLNKIGIATVQPPGGHAVYVDAKQVYAHIPPSEFPAQVMCCELFRLGGIRGVEIGSLMFGKNENGVEIPADRELVRLALPRRVYTQAHVNYVAEIFVELYNRRHEARGLKIVQQAPMLRHFTAHLAPVDA